MKTIPFFILIVLLLVGTLIFSLLNPGVLEPAVCLRDPQDCVGREIQMGHDARVIQVLPDGFIVDQLGTLVHVVGNSAGLQAGDSIQLRGIWQADGTLLVHEWHVSHQRIWRIGISLLAVLFGTLMFLRTFHINPKTRLFTEREPHA